MIATAFALPQSLFLSGSSSPSAAIMGPACFHSSYTDLLLSALVRQQVQAAQAPLTAATPLSSSSFASVGQATRCSFVANHPLVMARSRSCDSAFATRAALAGFLDTIPAACAEQLATAPDKKTHKRRVSFMEPLELVHEVERILFPQQRVRELPEAQQLQRREDDASLPSPPSRLDHNSENSSYESTRTTAKKNKARRQRRQEQLEEHRWEMACKLAEAVGVGYLVVSFGDQEDDVFEVECGGSVDALLSGSNTTNGAGSSQQHHNSNGHCMEASLDEVFDFLLLRDHFLV